MIGNLNKISPKKTALLIIDMQNDFIEKGAIFEMPNIRSSLLKFKKFIDECRKKGILIIYTRHSSDPNKNPIEFILFPEQKEKGLRKGTKGFEINKIIKPKKSEIVINKNRYDAFYKTNLEKELKKRKIENVIITGTMTNVCCESTARSAMYRDYKVFFIPDLTFTEKKELHRATLSTISHNFGWVIGSEKILKLLKKENE
jgi:nicotinamidase-related amidase